MGRTKSDTFTGESIFRSDRPEKSIFLEADEEEEEEEDDVEKRDEKEDPE